MKTSIKIVAILAVIVSIVVYLVHVRSTRALKVEVVPAEKGDIILSISAPGEIKSENEANLKFTSAGRIIYLPYKIGDKVKKGEKLASLDGTQTLKNLENARLDKKKALDFANEIRETFEGNIDEGPGLYKLKQAEKAVEQAENQIKIYENALYNITLYAPFSGTIIEINTKEGENAQITDAILKLADLESLYFEALVDEEDLGQITIGQKAMIELDAYADEKFSGTVFNLDKTTSLDSAGNKVIKTKIKIEDLSEAGLRLGLSGDAEIVQQIKKDVLRVPLEMVFKELNEDFVYVIEGEYALKQKVTLGLENDDFIEVLSGLSVGDRVIVSEIEKISSGQRIVIAE